MELVLEDESISDKEIAVRLGIAEEEVSRIRNFLGKKLVHYIKRKGGKRLIGGMI